MGWKATNPVGAVVTAFDVIEALKANDGGTVTEVAETLELPASTVHNHLSTLRERGYVVADGGTYQLAARFAHLGDYVKQRHAVYRVGLPAIAYLAETTGEIVNLLVEENGRGIYLASKEGTRGLHNFASVRERDYLHSTASGKAILANLPPAREKEILEEWGQPRRTAATITDRDELLAQLEEIREQGYALNDKENTEGLRAVGAPVQLPDGSYAAISVAGPATRIRGEEFRETLPERVMETARVIEADLVG